MADVPRANRLAELVMAMQKPGQPQAFFEAVDAAMLADIGRVFTTLLLVHRNGEGQRVFTTTDAYPVGARKPLIGTSAADPMLGRGEPFLAPTPEAIKARYPTWDILEKLGCGALANIPVIYDGGLVALLNMGQKQGIYGPAHMERAMLYATALGPVCAVLRAA